MYAIIKLHKKIQLIQPLKQSSAGKKPVTLDQNINSLKNNYVSLMIKINIVFL